MAEELLLDGVVRVDLSLPFSTASGGYAPGHCFGGLVSGPLPSSEGFLVSAIFVAPKPVGQHPYFWPSSGLTALVFTRPPDASVLSDRTPVVVDPADRAALVATFRLLNDPGQDDHVGSSTLTVMFEEGELAPAFALGCPLLRVWIALVVRAAISTPPSVTDTALLSIFWMPA